MVQTAQPGGELTIDDCLALLRAWQRGGLAGKLEIGFEGEKITSITTTVTPAQGHGPPPGGHSEPPAQKFLPKTSNWRLEGCPRCGGDLQWEEEICGCDGESGVYVCVQCGARA